MLNAAVGVGVENYTSLLTNNAPHQYSLQFSGIPEPGGSIPGLSLAFQAVKYILITWASC